MAKRKRRRRPSAGPPPGQRPAATAVDDGGKAPKAGPKGPQAPKPPGYRGALIRAALVAVFFYPYLVYLAGEPPSTALLISLGALAVMIPAGILLDRMRYRFQMRRYRQQVESPKPE